jgi:hypothetical protein
VRRNGSLAGVVWLSARAVVVVAMMDVDSGLSSAQWLGPTKASGRMTTRDIALSENNQADIMSINSGHSLRIRERIKET